MPTCRVIRPMSSPTRSAPPTVWSSWPHGIRVSAAGVVGDAEGSETTGSSPKPPLCNTEARGAHPISRVDIWPTAQGCVGQDGPTRSGGGGGAGDGTMVTRRADGYRNSPTPTTRSCHASLSYEGNIRRSSTTIIWVLGSWNREYHASIGSSCSCPQERTAGTRALDNANPATSGASELETRPCAQSSPQRHRRGDHVRS